MSTQSRVRSLFNHSFAHRRRALGVARRAFRLFLLAVITLFSPALARAAVFTVANTDDSGAGSLRDAIANAGSGDTITFSSVVFGTVQTITLTSGPINLPQNITITGPLAGVVI